MTAPAHISLVDVDETLVPAFLDYALAHGIEHDDTYTTPEELERFDLASEPAVLALDADGTPVGAASVMARGYQDVGHGRFRILHAADPEVYPLLIERVLARLPDSVKRVFLFLPDAEVLAAEALRMAGFAESRRAYILVHLDPRNAHVGELPGGTVLKQAFPPDAGHWMHIVNEAFAGRPGRPDMDLDRARELLGRRRVIRDGTLIAWRDDAPAGVVMSVIDEDDHTVGEIETLAVVPSDQGIGLGRALLRSALVAIAREGLASAELSVATDNRRALALYFDVGFKLRDVRVCWEKER